MCFKTANLGDFPGGPVVKDLPCNADKLGSIPCQGTKISHASEQLSLCIATTEAHTVWSLHATAKTQHSQINIF